MKSELDLIREITDLEQIHHKQLKQQLDRLFKERNELDEKIHQLVIEINNISSRID